MQIKSCLNWLLICSEFRVQFSVNFDNPTKRKYAIERYQMFLWIFEKKNQENAKNRHFLEQHVQIDNDFW